MKYRLKFRGDCKIKQVFWDLSNVFGEHYRIVSKTSCDYVKGCLLVEIATSLKLSKRGSFLNGH